MALGLRPKSWLMAWVARLWGVWGVVNSLGDHSLPLGPVLKPSRFRGTGRVVPVEGSHWCY
jgi:hypothetical protein